MLKEMESVQSDVATHSGSVKRDLGMLGKLAERMGPNRENGIPYAMYGIPGSVMEFRDMLGENIRIDASEITQAGMSLSYLMGGDPWCGSFLLHSFMTMEKAVQQRLEKGDGIEPLEFLISTFSQMPIEGGPHEDMPMEIIYGSLNGSFGKRHFTAANIPSMTNICVGDASIIVSLDWGEMDMNEIVGVPPDQIIVPRIN